MKRLVTKYFALSLVLAVFAGFFMPTQADARPWGFGYIGGPFGNFLPSPYNYYYPYPYYHHRHRHDVGDVLAAAAVVGTLNVLLNQQYQEPSYTYSYSTPVTISSYTPDYTVVVETEEERYARKKLLFIYKMDKKEKVLWDKIKLASPGKYYIDYEDSADARRIKKFAKNLTKDLRVDKIDTDNKQVFFEKLSEAENE